MKTILEDVPYDPNREPDDVEVIAPNESKISLMRRFPLPVLARAELFALHAPATRIPVNVLLDTGTDITVVNPSLVATLNLKLPPEAEVQLSKKINFYNVKLLGEFQNAYKLGLALGDHTYSSNFGFIAPRQYPLEDMDVWLGQDILQQLVVTFDGPGQKFTITDPNSFD